MSRVVKEKRIYKDRSDPSSLQSKTKYARVVRSTDTKVTVDETDAVNNLLSRSISYFSGDPKIVNNTVWASGFGFGITPWTNGFEYETDRYASDGSTLLRRTLREQQNRSLSWWTVDQKFAPSNDPRPASEAVIQFENGQAIAVLKKTEYDENGSADPTYFSHLNFKRAKAYGYKVLSPSTARDSNLETISALFTEGDLVSLSETDYLYDEHYKTRHLLSLPIETRILNPTNQNDILAKSQVLYDEQNKYYSMSDYGATVGYESPSGVYSYLRGNSTTNRTWVKDSNTWLETHTQHDNFGNVRRAWDRSGDSSRFVEMEYSPQYYYTYPTKVTTPAPDPTNTHGTNTGSFATTTYDFTTGLPLTVTNEFGQTTATEYNDPLLRPTRSYAVNFTAPESQTIYNDAALTVKIRKQLDENNWAEKTAFYDTFGRAYKSRTKDLQGDVVTEVKFDNLGRVRASSNPYRVDTSGNPTETVYWSKPRYDELNRAVESYAPAAVDPNNSALHGASFGTIEFGISTLSNLVGTYKVATDASGRKSRSISGIYGIMRLDEATGISGTTDADLGTLASPNQPTIYGYNLKGELIKITQGNAAQAGQPIQNRYFMYDSLGRLIRVRQPEQIPNSNLATSGNPENNEWTASYSYNVLGNVVRVTDAKGINIINEYDKASRPTVLCYSKPNINTSATTCNGLSAAEISDDTTNVSYFYDGKGLAEVPQFSRGALTKVTNTISEDRFTSFDNRGRLLSSQQITDNQTYNFGYKYNLSGSLLEETYPSGRIVRNFLDNDGGLSSVTSKAVNGPVKQVASNFDYSTAGDVRKFQLGNGLWETAQFNERYQLTQVGLGTTQTNKSLFKVDYEYGELNSDGTTVETSKNTGMIAKTTTTIPTTNFVQAFKYDAIKRLTEARETAINNQPNWIQTFGYDCFGNRNNFTQVVGDTTLATNNITKPTIDPTSNRFTIGQGYVYDFNGNLIQDAEGRSFKFDGNDKQIEVRDTNNPNQITGSYFYDASGARVKKVAGNETTIFVYDAGGALAAEYSTQTQPVNPTTSYLTTDHLGSPRVITDATGQVTSRRDFMPFGEELSVGVGARSMDQKYSVTGSDNIRNRFTGYEKDEETQLDFAEARMYRNRHGRFTAVDPGMADANLANPQSFNGYAYAHNNPVNITDPGGTCVHNGVEDGKPCGNYSGQLYVRDGFYSPTPIAGGVPVTADTQVNAYGATYQITGGPNGGYTRIDPVAVQATNDGVLTTTSTELSSAISYRPMLSLPCVSGIPCGSSAPSSPSLDMSQNEPLQTVAAIKGAAELLQLVPGPVGVAGSIITATISVGQGDLTGAEINLAMAVPGLRQLRGAGSVLSSGIKAARELGIAGERAAGISGVKKAIEVGGRKLFPDAVDVTSRTLTEVKNVKRLSFTRQLRDYAAYAQKEGFKFNLITRPGTRLSGPLKMAIENGIIIHKPILPF